MQDFSISLAFLEIQLCSSGKIQGLLVLNSKWVKILLSVFYFVKYIYLTESVKVSTTFIKEYSGIN